MNSPNSAPTACARHQSHRPDFGKSIAPALDTPPHFHTCTKRSPNHEPAKPTSARQLPFRLPLTAYCLPQTVQMREKCLAQKPHLSRQIRRPLHLTPPPFFAQKNCSPKHRENQYFSTHFTTPKKKCSPPSSKTPRNPPSHHPNTSPTHSPLRLPHSLTPPQAYCTITVVHMARAAFGSGRDVSPHRSAQRAGDLRPDRAANQICRRQRRSSPAS